MNNIKNLHARPLPTEDEIISSWTQAEKPLVSVCCTTFNHEKYIENALKGFLIQKTEFPFEILIHDDASTDRTPEIVSYYAAKYPRIIKLILQSENQYSKGNFKPAIYTASKAKGKYIALCEGDDFWLSDQKLQLQASLLEAKPEIKFCFHAHTNLYPDGHEETVIRSRTDREFSPQEMVRGGANFCHTGAMFFHRSDLERFPQWFYGALSGDIFIQIFGSMNGAAYLTKVMSVYRIFSEGSFTSRATENLAKKEQNAERLIGDIGNLYSELGDAYVNDLDILCLKIKLGVLAVAIRHGNLTAFRQWLPPTRHLVAHLGLKGLLYPFISTSPALFSIARWVKKL